MSRSPKRKIYREVESVLRTCGRPWNIIEGKKHKRVMIDGVQVAVFSKSPTMSADALDIIAAIKRHCRRTSA